MNERFRLIIDHFSSDESIRQACQIIYATTDPKLIASMGSTPYEIGRSFSVQQKTELKARFLELKIEFRFINETTGEVESSSSQTTTPEGMTHPKFAFKITKQNAIISLSVFFVLAVVLVVFQFFLKPPERMEEKTLQRDTQVQSSRENPLVKAVETPKAQPLNIEFFEAQITKIENKVEIRRKNALEWEPATVEMRLQQGDRVRTFARAFCTFQYREGSNVQVSEDSLVVVGKSMDQPQLVSRELALENGSLRTQLVAGQKDQQIGVETNQGYIQFEHSKSTNQSTQFETVLRNNNLNVRVARGVAQFKKSKEDAEGVIISDNQQIMVTETSVSEPVTFRPPLRLLQPEDGTRLQYSGQVVGFSWENIGFATYEFILAGDIEMENILFSKIVHENRIELNYLDSGFLFWQVKAYNDNTEYLSPIYRIHVQ